MRLLTPLGSPTVEISTKTNRPGQETDMLWHAFITPQRLTSRGEAAMTCASRSDWSAGSEKNHDLGRWRS
ncbi:hypothetical protein GCM10009779_49700 [Polymorphospora rubra]|uniref:Uncharacterized protein n=1 Tax=Polymorphospora rubra TaxID=338584 RepID=A0A810N7D9_9ACTN|nr:hypothetical protein Prubr_54050 [Polymorphospora rubra]